MLKLKTIKKYAELSGYSEKAIRLKISGGIWGDGIKYKAPDGRVLISEQGVENWVLGKENTRELNESAGQLSELASPISENLGEKLRLLRQEMNP
jgi:hypothetical protein